MAKKEAKGEKVQEEEGTRFEKPEAPEGPAVREGEVYESMETRDDDVGGGRRRVKVLMPDDGGKVLVENLSTRRKSHISLDTLRPPHWDRYV